MILTPVTDYTCDNDIKVDLWITCLAEHRFSLIAPSMT